MKMEVYITKKEVEAIDRALRYDRSEMERDVIKLLERILKKYIRGEINDEK